MSRFYLDSSAVAKRYLPETGTAWIRTLTDPATGNTIVLAEITQVEVAAALAASHRAPGDINRQERNGAVRLLARHSVAGYEFVAATRSILDRAIALTQRRRLRGHDAVQLATALAANAPLVAAGLPDLTLAAADDDLVAATRAEGLAAENPNAHR